MKLNKLIIPVACILLAGNASMAQVIMPWENRTETDGDPFAKGETTATKGKLHLEEIIGGRLIQTKGIGAMTWMSDTAGWNQTLKQAVWTLSPTAPKTTGGKSSFPLPCLSTKKPGSQLPSAASLGAPTTGRS